MFRFRCAEHTCGDLANRKYQTCSVRVSGISRPAKQQEGTMSNGISAPSHSHAPWIETAQTLRHGYRGPERRSDVVPIGKWLAASLDEIDYGVLLVRDATTVAHANHAARAELAGDH